MKCIVDWETDGERVDLPEVVDVPNTLELDEIADYLSEEYGWLVSSVTVG